MSKNDVVQITPVKQISARKLTILLLLAVEDASEKPRQPILGTTRIQKLAFLVSEKARLALQNSASFRFDFNYEPEKFGPADLDLYHDLEFLKTMRLITWDRPDAAELSPEPSVDSLLVSTGTRPPALLPEEREEEELSFEYLMGADPLELLIADTETDVERRYFITDKGLEILNTIGSQSAGCRKDHFDTLQKACKEVRRQFGDWPLKRLLKYVYDNYPSLTTKSTILDRVKGTR